MKILLIVADSLRPDYLGCYNPARATPAIDALAARGVLCRTAVTAAPWTVPAVASLLTGVWAHRLGLVKWEQPWRLDTPTLFAYFRAAGYAVGSFVFEPDQMFRRCPEAQVVGSSQDPDLVLAWLREHRRTHYFAFVHWWWTHVPYLERRLPLPAWHMMCKEMLAMLADPDAQARARHRETLRRLYAESVQSFSEKWVPRFLDAGRPDAVIITADHGESWGERMPEGTFPRRIMDMHGHHLHDEVLRIPLILYAPDFVPPGRLDGLARSVDIAPTALELAGLRADPRSQCGLSLCASARARTAIRHGPAIFSRHRDFAAAQAVPRDVSEVYEEFGARDESCKVLHHTGRRDTVAYDLAADPHELSPIAPETPGAARLASVLADEMRRASVGVYDEGEFAHMRRQLAQLGYL